MSDMRHRSNMEVFSVKFIKKEPQTLETSSCQVPVVGEHNDQTECLQEVGSSLQKEREHIAIKEEDHDIVGPEGEAESDISDISDISEERVQSSIQEDHGNSGWAEAERATSRQSCLEDQMPLTPGSESNACLYARASSNICKEDNHFTSEDTNVSDEQNHSAANDSHQVYQYQMSKEKLLTSEHNGYRYSVFEERSSMTNQREEINDGWSLNETNPSIRTPDVSLSRSYSHHQDQVEENSDGWLPYDTNPSLQTPGHTGERLYSCHRCGKRFATKQAVNSHMQFHKPYHCPKCNKGYYAKEELAEHIETHNLAHAPEIMYHCTYMDCDKEFPTHQGLSRHMQAHPQEKPFQCPECHKGFGTQIYLNAHMKLHSREPKFRCVECGEGFFREGHFARHMAKHKGQKLFQCPVCHKEYISKGQFDLHMKTHIKNGELNYKCSQCDKSYPYEHLTELGSEGPHQCIECDKGILKVQHISSYKKVNVFRCPHCYERFLKVVDLTKHVVQVHPENECHRCPECDKTFPLKLKLAVHMQVHRKEKQDCPLCCMVLGSKRALKGHLRMHQGERKYKCSLCDKTYLHLQSLKNHVVTHNGMKQFKCALCDKAFSHESTLRHHEKKHTVVKPRRRIQKPKPFLYQETRAVSEEQNTFPGKDLQERHEHHVHEPAESNPSFKSMAGENDSPTSVSKNLQSVLKETSSMSCERDELNSGRLEYDGNPLFQKEGLQTDDTIPLTGHPGEGPHSCHKCGKRFATKHAVNSHMQFHKPYHCPKCNKGYYAKEELAEHMDTHNVQHDPEMMYQCTYLDCDKEFPTYQGLSSHMQKHPREKPFSCPQCNKAFGSRNNLRGHIKLHTREPKFWCVECGEAFLREGHFARHMAQHRGQKLFTCPFCLKKYNFKRRFEAHVKTHVYKCSHCEKTHPAEYVNKLEGEKPQKCDECTKGFLEVQVQEDAFRHKRRGVRCHHCLEKFPNVAILVEHLEMAHPGKDSHQCPECGKTFPLQSKLRTHLQVHRKEKQDCPLCGVVLASKRALKGHLRMHRDERRYECSTCGKKFLHQSSLTYHVRSHTGSKPYKCSLCEKSFACNASLKSHHRTHTGEKPHLCSLCGKTFREKSDLQAHLRSHAGERPFECVDCNKSYTSRSSLRLHMRTHVGGKQFPCPECNERFYTKTILTAHLKTHS